jgi:archaellum component FlaC
MKSELSVDGNRVDAASQKILWAMRDGEWKYGLPLRKAADLEENRQVFYRMEEHLKPAGLAAEATRNEENEARQFGLTKQGAAWVDKHSEELRAPTTREEIAEQAREGYEAGTSARESVQKYRKKVSRIEDNLDELTNTVGEIEDQQETDDDTLEFLDERSDENRERSKENKEEFQNLSEAVKDCSSAQEVDDLQTDINDIERQLNKLRIKQAGIMRQQAHMEYDRTRLFGFMKPAGYLAAAALGVYFVILTGSVLIAPGLVVSVLIAAVTGLIGVAFGTGIAIYARGLQMPLSDLRSGDDFQKPSAVRD